MIWLLVVLVTIVPLFYLYRVRNANYWQSRGVPIAKGYHWFFGHSKPLAFREKHYAEIFSDAYYEYPDSSVVGILQMTIPILIIKDPEVIKAILTTDFNHFGINKNRFTVAKSDILIRHHPFMKWGEAWKRARGHATPSVTFVKLKGYLPAMLAVGDELVKYARNHMDEHGAFEVEAREMSSKYTMDVIANAVCGIKNNVFENKNSVFAAITEGLFDSFFLHNMRSFAQFLFPDIITSIRITPKHSEKGLLSLTKKMMKEKEESSEVTTDLFQQLLACKRNDREGLYTDEYIASLVFAFMLDGIETSSVLICYALFELAWHAEIQDKLRNEVRELLARTKGEYTAEDIEGLKYLDMVVSESLRLHPPSPFLKKICTEPYKLTVHGCKDNTITIHKGTYVHIPVKELQRDPKYYPDPERFDPERFSEKEVAARHKFVFLPFGGGPRRCLGQRFGLLQAKVALMKIMENFVLKPSTKSKYPATLDPNIFMVNRPRNGVWLNMVKINK